MSVKNNIYFLDKIPKFYILLIAISCLLTLDYFSNNGNLASLSLLIILILFTLAIKFSLGVSFFIIIFVFSDIFSTENLYSNSGMSSLHSLYLGPFSIGVWLLLLVFIIVLFQNLRNKKRLIIKLNKRLYPFLLLTISGVSTGCLNLNLNRIFIKHLAPYIVFFVVLYIVIKIYDSEQKKRRLLNIFLLFLFAKSVIIYFKYILGIGSDKAYLLVVSYDPIGSFPILLICLSITSLFFIRKYILYNLINIFLSLSIILYSSGRSTMLFLLFFLVIFIFCLIFIKTEGIFKITSRYSSLIIIALLTPFILFFIRGSFLNYAIWRYLKTITEFSALDSSVRAATIANTYFDHISNNTLMLGKGFGGYILDKWVPFEIASRDISKAFNNSSIISGKFHSMHEQVFDIFLQNGLFGVLLIFLLIYSFTRLFIQRFRSCSSYYHVFSLACILPFLNLILVGFTIKSFFVASILFLFMFVTDGYSSYEAL